MSHTVSTDWHRECVCVFVNLLGLQLLPDSSSPLTWIFTSVGKCFTANWSQRRQTTPSHTAVWCSVPGFRPPQVLLVRLRQCSTASEFPWFRQSFHSLSLQVHQLQRAAACFSILHSNSRACGTINLRTCPPLVRTWFGLLLPSQRSTQHSVQCRV